jgi:hypothetical protein
MGTGGQLGSSVPPAHPVFPLHSFIMRAILLPLALLPLLAAAQSWCPPGATWTYTYSNGWNIQGVATFSHAADTTIDGSSAQRIDWQINATQNGVPLPSVQPSFYTKVDGPIVSIQWEGQFDTLYHFGVVPGDSWHPADWVEVPEYRWLVTDTGTVTLDGLDLRFLVVENNWTTDTIVERLGALRSFMLPWEAMIIDAPSGPLRCYSDNEVGFHASWWNYGCTSLVSVDEVSAHDFDLFPNPGTTHFSLDLPPGPHTITLFDATGRMVLQHRTAYERPVIDTITLPTGLYLVRIVDRSGAVHHHQWIKS